MTDKTTAQREVEDPLRDTIKHALRNVKWTETGELLGYIPEGVLGMYADAVLDALSDPDNYLKFSAWAFADDDPADVERQS